MSHVKGRPFLSEGTAAEAREAALALSYLNLAVQCFLGLMTHVTNYLWRK